MLFVQGFVEKRPTEPSKFAIELCGLVASMSGEELLDRECVDGRPLAEWTTALLHCDTSRCEGVVHLITSLPGAHCYFPTRVAAEREFTSDFPSSSRSNPCALLPETFHQRLTDVAISDDNTVLVSKDNSKKPLLVLPCWLSRCLDELGGGPVCARAAWRTGQDICLAVVMLSVRRDSIKAAATKPWATAQSLYAS